MIVERGPSKSRGRPFSQEPAPQLQSALQRAAATLRMIQAVSRPSFPHSPELLELRRLDQDELTALRRKTRDLLTDLRAELRRRGHF